MSNEIHHGSCGCGKVSFKVTGPLRDIVACHCSQCRKQTGLFYAATVTNTANIEITGRGNITWYQSSSDTERGFCKVCGSALFWVTENDDKTYILAGALDQPTNLKISAHIYCGDKADFYEINDDAPQFINDME